MKYFTIDELCRSTKASQLRIANTPTEEIKKNLTLLTENVLDKLREAYGKPIKVNSGYRCKVLNKIVGGVATSYHLKGMAADIVGQGGLITETKKIYDLVDALGLKYTECIWEHNRSGSYWLHIAYDSNNLKMKKVTNLLKK